MSIFISSAVAAAIAGAVVDWFFRTYTTVPIFARVLLTFLVLLLVYGGTTFTIGTR